MAGESDLRTVSANHVLGVDHQERKCDSDASDAEESYLKALLVYTCGGRAEPKTCVGTVAHW